MAGKRKTHTKAFKAQVARNRLKADPLSGHLFIFRNKTADRLKVLSWGGHGLWTGGSSVGPGKHR